MKYRLREFQDYPIKTLRLRHWLGRTMGPVQVVLFFGLSFFLICCQGMHFTSLHRPLEERSSIDDERLNP